MAVRPQRTQQVPDRAASRGFGRAGAAYVGGKTVAAAILGAHHRLRDHHDFSLERTDGRSQERLVISERGDLSLNALRRRRNTAAQSSDDQALGRWTDDL